ncbi:MAG: GWxTD domain-containing protein [Bacteroidota bacterium]
MFQTLKSGLIVVLILFTTQVNGLDLTRFNLSFHYDITVESQIAYRVTDDGEGQYSIIYHIEHDTTDLWKLSILAQNGYSSEEHDTLSLDMIDTVLVNPDKIFLSVNVPKNKYDLLVFSLYNLSEGVYRVYDIPLNAPGGYPRFYPVDEDGEPLLSNYYTGDELSFVGSDSSLHVFQYKEEFGPADPAMGEMGTLAPTLSIDSSYFIGSSFDYLEDFHFYLFQKDTLDNTGITILKVPYYYPELRSYDELIKPMRYITTSVENQALNQATNQRKAFENFWLTTYGTKFRAKSAIRFFFQRIEEANLLFTDYKLGWKTDRGVLYIIYGKPDYVIKNDRTEVWRYENGERFEFIRIPILFTPSLYSLRRNSNYEQSWYSQVGSIRKGQ